MTPDRRDVLEFAATTATAATIATAGWSAVAAQEDEDGDGLPPYSQWLTLEDGTLEFTYVDWATLEEYVGEELEEASPDEDVPEEYRTDPMIAPVSEGLISAYFFVGLNLGRFGLGRLLEVNGEFESTAEELVRVDEAFVVTGAMVPEEIDERLTREPIADFIVQMERTDEIDGYDVYTPIEEGVDVAIGVDEDALVVDGGETDDDPVTALETTIDASAGDADRATDESETLAWLLETAGDGDVAVGQYGGPFDTEELRHPAFEGLKDAEGFVSSFTVEDEETLVGDLAAVIADSDEDALEEFVGVSADERSIDVEGDRVTATGTWREEVRYE